MSFSNRFKKTTEPQTYPEEWLLSDEERLYAKQQTLQAINDYAAFSKEKHAAKNDNT